MRALRKNLEQKLRTWLLRQELLSLAVLTFLVLLAQQLKLAVSKLLINVSIPVSAASPKEGLSLSDTTNSQEDDSEIPPLEDIHQDTTDALILGDPTSAKYKQEAK
ncbi:hypothetical protein Tco_0519292 [Tanacetum coccineum]